MNDFGRKKLQTDDNKLFAFKKIFLHANPDMITGNQTRPSDTGSNTGHYSPQAAYVSDEPRHRQLARTSANKENGRKVKAEIKVASH